MSICILLVNLGTVENPTPSGVKDFLKDFLWDKHVVRLPRLLWGPVLYGYILPRRSKRVAKLYQNIWMPQGSPLKVNTEALTQGLIQHFNHQDKTTDIDISYGMTYGSPNLKQILAAKIDSRNTQNIRELIVLPLFPFYSESTSEPIRQILTNFLHTCVSPPQLHFLEAYDQETDFIEAIQGSILNHWEKKGRSDKLLFSFHGIPRLRDKDKGQGSYRMQCLRLANQLANRLKIPENTWGIGFQSRFGWAPWSQPTTASQLITWANAGCMSVDVVAPGFAVDCLETLEELEIQHRAIFMAAGGKSYHYIPALNQSSAQITMLAKIIEVFFKKIV